MTTPGYQFPQQQALEPTEEQKQRLAARRRFNWSYVYAPIILFSLVILSLIGLLIYGVLSPNGNGTAEFASALADIILIMTITPLLLLCALPTLLFAGVVVYRRQQRKEKKERGELVPEHGRVQRLFWRLDNLLTRIQTIIQQQAPKGAGPIINVNAWLSYLLAFWQQLKSFLPGRNK